MGWNGVPLQPGCNWASEGDDDCGSEEDATCSRASGEHAEQWTGDSEREVEERRIGSHGETAAFCRSAADGFHPETRIDQRVSEASQDSTSSGDSLERSEPNRRQADRLQHE